MSKTIHLSCGVNQYFLANISCDAKFQGAKKDTKASKAPAKAPKKKEGGGGGKAKKKKWSKGKTRDKLNNLVLFDKATYDKLMKEVSEGTGNW